MIATPRPARYKWANSTVPASTYLFVRMTTTPPRRRTAASVGQREGVRR